MNPNDPSLPPQTGMNERIMTTLRARQRSLQVLTGIAMLFGFLAIAVSVLVVFFYFIFYLPKQKQLLLDYGRSLRQTQAAASVQGPEDGAQPRPLPADLANAHITMTHVTSIGTIVVAASVGVLGIGTLVSLGLIALNRRITLKQISTSLTQISEQIRQLQQSKSSGSAPP